MANAPQPGRIPPIQPTTKNASSTQRTAPQKPVELPKPVEKKITGFGQAVFIAFAVCVDIVELLLDLIAIGVVVNRIIDIVVAIIFFIYAYAKGLKPAVDTKVYGSIVGTIIGEFIPGLDIAPFFTLDAWYITHSIKAKDKARQQAVDEETRTIIEEQERQEWIENYQQQQVTQVQEENEQAEEQEESEQEMPEQKTNWQNDGGAGRINSPRFKTPSSPPSPQPAGKPVGNSGIIK